MSTIIQTITNPAILSLCAGLVVGIFTRFEIPKILSNIVSLYLIFCIGFKGGMCLGITNACSPSLIALLCVGAGIGFVQPYLYFWLLGKSTKLDRQTKVVVATQYGSTSIVTFVTAMSFLQQNAIMYNTFMSAVAGVMELPAIFSGLLLLKGLHPKDGQLLQALKKITYEIVFSPKINFIFIGFFVGFLLKGYQTHPIPVAILWPFTAMLVLFMLESGIKIAQQRAYIYEFTWSLIAFGIYVPIISSILSIGVCYLLGISAGTALLFIVLIGSASYIAVPAVMRAQATQAKSVIYLALALGIMLPFNLIFGIPLFYYIAWFVL